MYHCNVLKVQKLFCVPECMARCASFTLEPLLLSANPTQETPIGMGATLEIQRQQRTELLDQQMMLAQLNQNNRRHRGQVVITVTIYIFFPYVSICPNH